MEALEYGLMPCAGWGIGLDRLVMLLTGQERIQEVIVFPLLREMMGDGKEDKQAKDSKDAMQKKDGA